MRRRLEPKRPVGTTRVVAIGGFDPSGRAGVLADAATLRDAGARRPRW